MDEQDTAKTETAEEAAQAEPEAEPESEKELRCTLCGLRACWTK